MVLTKIPGGLIEDGSITSADITDSTITNAKMAVDPANASNLSSGDVPAAQLGNVPAVDLSTQSDDIALLAFKTQANGNLARYNLVDQSVDAFEDASGVNAGSSTNEYRNTTGKYFVGASAAPAPTISGNYDTTGTDGDYTWYKWTTVTSSGSYTTNTAQDYEYLVIAGGGGGGGHGGSGGGAGGYRTATGFAIGATTISGITVGAGGAGGANANASKGSNSVFSTITSTGGGLGGGGGNNPNTGGTGGSGGGGRSGAQPAGNEGSYSPVEGYEGGTGITGSANWAMGGGGGAGEAGKNGTPGATGGDGGDGRSSSIDGSATTRAGGGGGSDQGNPGGVGGAGGGGNAGNGLHVTDGAVNTGSGGGGNHAGAGSGGAGGSGIVIIRRLTVSAYVEGSNMTLVSNSVTAQAQPTKADVVLTYTNGAGTATVNTDLIASVSRDNGTTYTAVTLASQGTTGGHTILTANSVDISGQPAGTSMVWKVATANQSVSKITRIQAVSLGWS